MRKPLSHPRRALDGLDRVLTRMDPSGERRTVSSRPGGPCRRRRSETLFNDLNHEATLLLVEPLFGRVSDSAALEQALTEQPIAAAV